jgi:DNA invertase Pin-like site-specific DNA recombinase
MNLTPKEEKIARLVLDRAAREGERAAAAVKLIEILHKRGVTVEDIQQATTRVVAEKHRALAQLLDSMVQEEKRRKEMERES